MLTLPALSAFVAGLVFGATVQRTNFCTMGALSDLLLFGDARRLRAWLLAMAIALIGSQLLDLSGLVRLEQSLYLASGPMLAAALVGGLVFGFGMTQTGGCVSKTLVRLGAGNLKALVVLAVFAVVAVLTSAALGAGLSTVSSPSALAAGLTGATRLVVAVALGGGLLLFCLRDPRFRSSRADVAAGLILGALVPLAWLAFGGNGLGAINFVTPVVLPAVAVPGALLVLGVVVGAFAAARWSRTFRVERLAGRDDFRRHVAGGAMMGAGGALAMGCTIGHGIAGVSTLALGSLFALTGIAAGGIAGVRYLEHGSLRGAARALFAGS